MRKTDFFCKAVGLLPEALPSTDCVVVEKTPVEGYYLEQNTAGGWQLCRTDYKKVEIDFSKPYYRHRGGVEYLPKAFKNLSNNRILDATAGWARDAWLLAYRGYEVTLCEQHPYLYTLLLQGITQAQKNPEIQSVAKRLSVIYGNSLSLIQHSGYQFGAIYLDPMYPQRQKSAKVKKDMQILHDLLNLHSNVDDNDQLLQIALDSGCNRIVVKRPKNADYLAQIKPNHSVTAPNTRFDIYFSKH